VNQEAAAIKFLTRFDRYARFRDEVWFQQNFSDHPGVLPLLDSYLPDSPSKTNRPWLVTPYALPVREHIELSKNKLTTAVRIVRDIAATLVGIHARNAAHRDIKPENLFIYFDHAVIGDFGLASYPSKEAVTMPGERLGPIYYVAPELIGNTDEPLDCRPGDVYSLAKTLWVLATGQRYPLPGNLSANERTSQLSALVNHERAVLLDRLLDLATVPNPQQRPTCSDLVAELQAWLDEKKKIAVDDPISPSVSARLRQLTQVADHAQRERELVKEETSRILSYMHKELLTMGEEIASAAEIASRSRHLPDGNTNAALRYFPYRNDKNRISGGNRCFKEFFKTVDGTIIVALGCIVLESIPPAIGLMKGGLVIAANHRSPEYLLQREFEFRFASALQESSVAQFLSDMQDYLPILAERLAEVLIEENSIGAYSQATDSRNE
jgi:serine/threonine protein kinase